MSTILGVVVVAFAGLMTGTSFWPLKIMRRFQFEHWFFVGMLVGLVLMPWFVTLVFCPKVFSVLAAVDGSVIIKANTFAFMWGIANVLCGICFVRIGFAITGGILTGLGVSAGVTMPMIVKGTGLFKDAPSWGSPAAETVLAGVAIMLVAVVFVARAGYGRDRAVEKSPQRGGGFLGGLVMAVAAGLLSAGISFAFVYSQGPIVAAVKQAGGSDIPANAAVWALGLGGGALVNLLYPAYLMTRNKSWHVLGDCWRDVVLATLIGVNFFVGVTLLGKGMLLLGALGASVGFGIQQATQMLGNQGVGFISGEWRGVYGPPRRWMYFAIALLIGAALVMAYGNSLVGR
jgi:L-rhamnose-H+ transport protein